MQVFAGETEINFFEPRPIPEGEEHWLRCAVFVSEGRLSLVRSHRRVGVTASGKTYSRIRTFDTVTALRSGAGAINFTQSAHKRSGWMFFSLSVPAGLDLVVERLRGTSYFLPDGSFLSGSRAAVLGGGLDEHLVGAFGAGARRLFPLLAENPGWWDDRCPSALANAPDHRSAAQRLFGARRSGPAVVDALGSAQVGRIMLAQQAGSRIDSVLLERWLCEDRPVSPRPGPRGYQRVFAGCDRDSLARVLWSSGPDFESEQVATSIAVGIGSIPVVHAADWADVALDYEMAQMKHWKG